MLFMKSAVFLSDTHIGSHKSKAHYLLNFLKNTPSDTTYLVGDVIDIWAIKQAFRFNKQKQNDHINVVRKLLKRANKNKELHYIWGNHDELLSHFHNIWSFGNIHFHEKCEYVASDGRRYLVIHGHQFDILSKYKWSKFVGKLGDMGYDILIDINEIFNRIRRLLGYEYFSLSKLAKVKVKKAAYFISNFEECLADYAKQNNYDGVICGHIHDPADKVINGIHYLNCGCWTEIENLTYVIDKGDGSGLRLQKFTVQSEAVPRVE